jgi:hypothetical protein
MNIESNMITTACCLDVKAFQLLELMHSCWGENINIVYCFFDLFISSSSSFLRDINNDGVLEKLTVHLERGYDFFFILFCLKLIFFFMFLNYFDLLMLKIIF